MNQVIKTALINSSATALYVVAVSLFLNWGGTQKIGQVKGNFFLVPISFLMLFVFSAAFTGYFVFGKSILMYIDGKKKEAISVVTYTLIFLFSYTVLAISILILNSQVL